MICQLVSTQTGLRGDIYSYRMLAANEYAVVLRDPSTMMGILVYYKNGVVGKVDIPDMIIDTYLVSFATAPSTTAFSHLVVMARVAKTPPTPASLELKLYRISSTTAASPNPALTILRVGAAPVVNLVNPMKIMNVDSTEIEIVDVKPGLSTQTYYNYMNFEMPAAVPTGLTLAGQIRLSKPLFYAPAGRNFKFCEPKAPSLALYAYWSLGPNPEFGFAEAFNEYTVYSGGIRDIGVTEILKVECFTERVGVIGKIGANTVMIGYDATKVSNVNTRVVAIIKMGAEITNPNVYTENGLWYLTGTFSGTAFARVYNESGVMLYVKSTSIGAFTVNLQVSANGNTTRPLPIAINY